MDNTAKTQEELTTRLVQEDLQRRALELMRDAEAAGQVILIGMHTHKQRQDYRSKDFVIVAPIGGPYTDSLIYPDPRKEGPYRG